MRVFPAVRYCAKLKAIGVNLFTAPEARNSRKRAEGTYLTKGFLELSSHFGCQRANWDGLGEVKTYRLTIAIPMTAGSVLYGHPTFYESVNIQRPLNSCILQVL